MLLSATSAALARLRISDLTAVAPCGPSLFEHMGSCKQGGPVIDTRRDRYREAGEWQQAVGDQRDRAGQKVFARAGSPKTAQRSASGVLDPTFRAIGQSPTRNALVSEIRRCTDPSLLLGGGQFFMSSGGQFFMSPDNPGKREPSRLETILSAPLSLWLRQSPASAGADASR